MPPPTWIPGQSTPIRPPADTRHTQSGLAGSAASSLPVKEWEGVLRLDLPITQITTLPEGSDDSTFDGKLPPMSEEEVKSVLEWIEVDKAFASGMVDRKKSVQKKMVKWATNNDMDTPWWSVRKGERYMPPRARLQILFPRDKDAQRMRKSHKGRRYTR
jgi:SWI/SNF-related matrix-associated actin-dependent regulator of chromatin subfamily B protein 1